jgi:hypothetical protein
MCAHNITIIKFQFSVSGHQKPHPSVCLSSLATEFTFLYTCQRQKQIYMTQEQNIWGTTPKYLDKAESYDRVSTEEFGL